MKYSCNTPLAAIFPHPEPAKNRLHILPVFLPFSGCRSRCVYCQQVLATGRSESDLDTIYKNLDRDLSHRFLHTNHTVELAFYGGTFTQLTHGWMENFLDLARSYKEKGLVSRVRCSTKPDAVDPEVLEILASKGLDIIELGIQSFDDKVLLAAGRGYSGSLAKEACELVRDFGFELGIQLLPGLPAMKASQFLNDVDIACRLRPDIVRLYPCQVLRGTVLERLWTQGAYKPWGLAKTLELLAVAVLRFWRNGSRVIRQGLAAEPAMLAGRLAGPWHPALGQRIRSLALYHHVAGHASLNSLRVRLLKAPRSSQGEFWGHSKELLGLYAQLGITPDNVKFDMQSTFIMYYET